MVVFERGDLRISLITPRLLRTEKGAFCDAPTQTVQNRDFGEVKYSLSDEGRFIVIKTDEVTFKVRCSDGAEVGNPQGKPLPGTARTLDTANGAVKLEDGIVSDCGACVIDDSKSLIVNPDGTILARGKCSDRYWFVYGQDYLAALRDFFKLTGEVPLIPKYALGNWWSRYRAYTQEEYRTLMQEFIKREIPITVATIDMDWHWTDVISRFGEEARSQKPRCVEEIIYYYFLQGWTG